MVECVLLKMWLVLVCIELVKDWGELFMLFGYQLVFNDEFNGMVLDCCCWFICYINSNEIIDWFNDENQCYMDNGNYVEFDGFLCLVVWYKEFSQFNGLNYEFGMICFDFMLCYGFLEVWVKMLGGCGVWLVFWMILDVGEIGCISWLLEIDIFEFVNNVENDWVNKIYIVVNVMFKGFKLVWFYLVLGMKLVVNDWVVLFDFDKGWYMIVVEWMFEWVGWYVDGQNVVLCLYFWIYDDGVFVSFVYILFNFVVGGVWVGCYGIDDSVFLQLFDIDWVCVY